MKKIFALIISAFMLFALASCGGGEKPLSSEGASANTQSEMNSDKDDVLAKANKKAKKVIADETDDSMTDIEKARKTYEWLYYNFKYRAVAVDLSKGFTDELTAELSEYYFKYHKGSCEHYAAAQKVLFDNLGLETYYVEGERYDAGAGVWGEHVWLIVHYEGAYYHVDGLFGGNHTASLTSMFMVPDSKIEATHRWDKSYYPACTQPQLLV
jgi:transglutaminase/protease-like cytokinesis protein 3